MRILVISDLQAPFHHPDSIKFLKAVKKKYKTNITVCIGDEVDFHALSDYTPDPDGMSANTELNASLTLLNGLYEEFPKVMVCTSNHTSRPFRRAFKAGIPSTFLRSYSEFLKAPPGWHWRDKWEIDGIVFEHGESFGGDHSAIKHAKANFKSTVIGHHHSLFCIEYYQNSDKRVFGASSGCLIDDNTYAFRYNKHQKNRPQLGVVVILDQCPILVPMNLTKSGRWTRKI